MRATLSADSTVNCDGGTVDLSNVAPARKECLSEFSVMALVSGAVGLSGLLWAAIFFVI